MAPVYSAMLARVTFTRIGSKERRDECEKATKEPNDCMCHADCARESLEHKRRSFVVI